MGPDGVVVTTPALDDDLRLAQGVEDLAIEQLVPEAGIEALDVAVLPGAARSDLGGLGSDAEIRSWTAMAMNSGLGAGISWQSKDRRTSKPRKIGRREASG